MAYALLPRRGYAPLPTLIPSSLGRQGPPDSATRPLQLGLCCFRNLDWVINGQHKALKWRVLLIIAMEETKSRCGICASGDVIAKSTKARTPEMLPSKEATGRLRLTFHAAESLSVIGVGKEVMTYRYE